MTEKLEWNEFEIRALEVRIDRAIFGNKVVWRPKSLPEGYENPMLMEGYEDIRECYSIRKELIEQGKVKEEECLIDAYIKGTDYPVPPYARNMAYAWAIVNRLGGDYDGTYHQNGEHVWQISIENSGGLIVGGAEPTAPLAICLAAKEYIDMIIEKQKEKKDEGI